jgi:hypothetical protein
MLALINKFFGGIIHLKNCDEGVCREKIGGCAENEYQLKWVSGCSESQICCKPYEQTPGALQLFNAKEQEALQNAIIVTLNKDTKPIPDRSTINLKADGDYTFHFNINDKLLSNAQSKAKLGPCAVYVINSREQGKKYLLAEDGSLVAADQPIDFGRELANCSLDVFKTKKYKPKLLDAYKDLTLYVILFDKEFGDVYDQARPDFVGPLQPSDKMNIARSNLIDMYSNTQHWLAMRAYKLSVEPVVRFTGVSGDWVSKDQITINCDANCKKVGIKLVKNDKNDFDAMLAECTDSARDADFKYTLDYVSGTMTKTTGIPLNINIGGFRLPSQQQIKYVTSSKDIVLTMVDKTKSKADIVVDKATLLKTFYNNNNADYFIGETTYLCAKAILQDNSTVYGLSTTPLKVDVLPPYINQEDIKIIYPDIINATSKYTPYYYREYPRIVIPTCYDYGQSGCTNYDYYIHTGNFINLRVTAGDAETGIKALLLTEGLNALMNYFADQDAVNTLCPFITSPDYMRNTYQEIRFRQQGQGIICIRVSDKVGNSVIIWKSLWTPEEMFKRILAEGAALAVTEIVT